MSTIWSEFVEIISPGWVVSRVCGLGLAAYGFVVLKRLAGRRVMVSFPLAAAFALLLKYFGSFLSFAGGVQPIRFVLLTLPLGIALPRLADRSVFIALRDPPEEVTLYFNPWTMLCAP